MSAWTRRNRDSIKKIFNEQEENEEISQFKPKVISYGKENSEDGTKSPEERMDNYFMGAGLTPNQRTSNMCPTKFQNCCETMTVMFYLFLPS